MPCKHRVKLHTCSKCSQKVCFACAQLEVHGCPALSASAEEERRRLQVQLVKVVAAKVHSI